MGLLNSKSKSSMGNIYEDFMSGYSQELTSTSGRAGKHVREDVVVTTMTPGCGGTYISVAIANYLADVKRGRVIHVGDLKDEYVQDLLRPAIIQKKYPEDMQELYNESDCVIQDVGTYDLLNKQKGIALSKAATKIMVCHADDDSMRKLATFARERADADRFYYLFNVLPDEWRRKVYKTMNIYEAYCMPLFSTKTFDAETKQILRKIFGR